MHISIYWSVFSNQILSKININLYDRFFSFEVIVLKIEENE